ISRIIPSRTDSPGSTFPHGGERKPSDRPVFFRRPSRICWSRVNRAYAAQWVSVVMIRNGMPLVTGVSGPLRCVDHRMFDRVVESPEMAEAPGVGTRGFYEESSVR